MIGLLLLGSSGFFLIMWWLIWPVIDQYASSFIPKKMNIGSLFYQLRPQKLAVGISPALHKQEVKEERTLRN